jgi:hypothetical protein
VNTKPVKLTDDHLKFLDALRQSGATNMFGASPYLREEYADLSESEARAILSYWMRTFSERHPK